MIPGFITLSPMIVGNITSRVFKESGEVASRTVCAWVHNSGS